MTLRRTSSAVCLVVAGLAFAVAPASASPGDAVAAASAGAVSIGRVSVAPVAPCSTEGALTGQSGEVAVPDVVAYGPGRSTCTVDDAGEIAKASVTGGGFRFDALRQYGGPGIRLANFTSTCETTLTGSTSTIGFSGLSGMAVPEELPSNHVVTIPGGPHGRPMATVTFNEAVLPSPEDGSMTLHLMHIRVFPQGGPTSGDAYVGTVHCAPVS